jgi:hypothetical protein
MRSEPYTLHELEDGLDLSGPSKSEMRAEALELGEAGRNITVFDRLRFYAYQHVKHYREDATFEMWRDYLTAKADSFNVFDFGQPLHFSELQHIVKSVSTWTWKKYTGRLSDKAFSELQAYRGRISAKTRASTAKVEGTTLSKKMSELASKGISEKQPWKALGISRAQWYRDQKALIDNDSQP